jgi:hypothetical protein
MSGKDKPEKTEKDLPVTPAERHAIEAPDHVVTPKERARIAEEASREEDA